MNTILNYMISNNIIISEDKELYAYGIRQGLIMILNIATTLLIGTFLNMIWESLIFTTAYIPLRSFAGGYHARTQIRCYLFSIVLVSSSLILIKTLPSSALIVFTITFISSLIIFFLSPLGDANKPLSISETKIYKKKTHLILFIEVCLSFFLFLLGFSNASLCITLSLSVQSFMLLLHILFKAIYRVSHS